MYNRSTEFVMQYNYFSALCHYWYYNSIAFLWLFTPDVLYFSIIMG